MMHSNAYEKEQATAMQAVRAAARLCRAVQARISPEILSKKDRSPVTVADFGSQALVCRLLHEAFPNDPVIAEENSAALRLPENAQLLDNVVAHVRDEQDGAGADEVCAWIDFGGAKHYADRFWTLDPIDGTKGFLRAEQYAVALALVVAGRVTVAALACPNLPLTPGSEERGVAYLAVRGRGAVAVPLEHKGAGTPVTVSDLADATRARFCESVESGHSSHSDAAAVAEHLGITAAPVRLDSQAKYAVVARGEADIYLRLPTRPGYVEKIWDHGAGMLVVSEAGGTVTDIYGKPLEFDHGYRLEANKGVVVTNGQLHDAVLEALALAGVVS